MEINISNGIEVGALHYEIDISEEAQKELTASNYYGSHSGYLKRIRIDNTLQQDQFRNTFLHECVEAVNVNYLNCKLKHEDITNLANGLAQIIKSLGIVFIVAGKKK